MKPTETKRSIRGSFLETMEMVIGIPHRRETIEYRFTLSNLIILSDSSVVYHTEGTNTREREREREKD
jgi:hypothetical protein